MTLFNEKKQVFYEIIKYLNCTHHVLITLLKQLNNQISYVHSFRKKKI